ncbi:uncharacterized protein BDR25DRAFT_379579 [Lindgomyces ingoldianus]|uniref:Uncharacterized protein n=1 Tax=Lindgomyces ingoldianus TaxID=673940 RepID=A0ACB6RA31_9PLEO|nr:uncharacterized protein BDR25DRAFT_379579 [Lindgomyces ingoldianus]KAF2475952.1 hypothetical protein BDR25DRAFT_379579 [Lindgomyces ingoldianus]
MRHFITPLAWGLINRSPPEKIPHQLDIEKLSSSLSRGKISNQKQSLHSTIPLYAKKDMGTLQNLRRISAMRNDPPPPYTSELPTNSAFNDDLLLNGSQESPYPFHTPRASITQLRKYLIEIIAFTFGADFGQLNSMLDQNADVASRGTTILREEEKVELMRLSTLVENLRQKMLYNQFNTTLKRDRDIITDAIIKPAIEISLDPDYAMDLISTYADHQGDPTKRKFTLVSLYTPMFLRFKPYPATVDLRKTLISHAKVISAISLNESIQVALGKALADFQEKLGFKTIPDVYNDYCWPVRIGFWNLKNALEPLDDY